MSGPERLEEAGGIVTLEDHTVIASSGIAVPTQWRYDSADPFAVIATMRTRNGETAWAMDRELLADGLLVQPGQTIGMGHIQFHRDANVEDGMIGMQLAANREGSTGMKIPLPGVHSLVVRSFELVPPGSEYADFDFDTALSEFLAGPGRSGH